MDFHKIIINPFPTDFFLKQNYLNHYNITVYSFFKLTTNIPYIFIKHLSEVPILATSIVLFSNEKLLLNKNLKLQRNENKIVVIDEENYFSWENRPNISNSYYIQKYIYYEYLEDVLYLHRELLDYPIWFNFNQILMVKNYIKFHRLDLAKDICTPKNTLCSKERNLCLFHVLTSSEVEESLLEELDIKDQEYYLETLVFYLKQKKYFMIHNLLEHVGDRFLEFTTNHLNTVNRYIDFLETNKTILNGELVENILCKIYDMNSSLKKKVEKECSNKQTIFVIHLEKRKDRWESIEKYMKPYFHIIYIPAIENTIGWIGCFQSHQKAIQLAQQMNLETILVLEDDAIWNTDTSYNDWIHVKEWLDMNLHQWDIFLGGVIQTREDEIEYINTDLGIIRLDFFTSMHFSYYNSSIYSKILCIKHYLVPIDIYVSSIANIRLITKVPFISIQTYSYSDIEKQNIDYSKLYKNSEMMFSHLLDSPIVNNTNISINNLITSRPISVYNYELDEKKVFLDNRKKILITDKIVSQAIKSIFDLVTTSLEQKDLDFLHNNWFFCKLTGPLESQLYQLFYGFIASKKHSRPLYLLESSHTLFDNYEVKKYQCRFSHKNSAIMVQPMCSHLEINVNDVSRDFVFKHEKSLEDFFKTLYITPSIITHFENKYFSKFPLINSTFIIYDESISLEFYIKSIQYLSDLYLIQYIYVLFNKTELDISNISSNFNNIQFIHCKETNPYNIFIFCSLFTNQGISNGNDLIEFSTRFTSLTPKNNLIKNTICPNIVLNTIQKYFIENYLVTNKQTIGIIISVRNINESYIMECLDSLFKQTSKNWKAIIIYDGDSRKIGYKIPNAFKENIIEYRFHSWMGIVEINKKAISLLDTDIIGFLDSDDKLQENCLENVLELYEKHKNERIFIYTNYWICDKDCNIIKKGHADYVKKSLLEEQCGNPFRSFRRKDYYLTPRGFDEEFVFGSEDQDILFQLETIGCRPIFLSECLYYYRNNMNSLSKSKICKMNLETCVKKNLLERGENKSIVKNEDNIFTKYFDHIYVIHLEHEKELLEQMKIRLRTLNISFEAFLGVHGEKCLEEFNFKKIKGELEQLEYVGEYGYLQTMKNVFLDAKKNKYNKIMVFEVDVLFHRDFHSLFSQKIHMIPNDWKILSLGLSGPWTIPTKNLSIYAFSSKKNNYIQDFSDLDGSFAMGYDCQIYDYLLNMIEHCKFPYDTQLFYSIKDIQKDCYCVYPYLVIADVTRSGIRRTNHKEVLEYYKTSNIQIGSFI